MFTFRLCPVWMLRLRLIVFSKSSYLTFGKIAKKRIYPKSQTIALRMPTLLTSLLVSERVCGQDCGLKLREKGTNRDCFIERKI